MTTNSKALSVLYIKRFQDVRSPLAVLRKRFPEPFAGQDGFFRGSLHSACRVTERPWRYLAAHADSVGRKFDWVVINLKAGGPKRGVTEEEVRQVGRLKGCGKALFINYAKAGVLPRDAILDPFDLVFKREVLKDLDRYDVSAANREKLRTTMLACPLVPATRRSLAGLDVRRHGFREPSSCFTHDVFFSGADTNPMRRDVLARIAGGPLDFIGGLQDKSGAPLGGNPFALEKMTLDDYVRLARESRVNLALEGIGEFTFRHLELWCLCCFMLSSPSARDVRTPIEAEEGKHFVCFDNQDDLIDKLRHFRDADGERERIAREGRRVFERDYSFVKHGRCIVSSLRGETDSRGRST